MSDDGGRLTGLHGERNIPQHIPVVDVGKIDFVEFYLSRYPLRNITAGIPGDIGIVEDPEYPLAGDHPHLQDIELIGHYPQRPEEQVEIEKEGDNLAGQVAGL